MPIINVAEKAVKLLDELNKVGFADIPVLTIQKEGIWHEQYAIFVLQFNEPWFDNHHPYVTQEFDSDKFYDDFTDYLLEYFKGSQVLYREGCHEYEIIGPNYKRFYNKHKDKLEKIDANRESNSWVIYGN